MLINGDENGGTSLFACSHFNVFVVAEEKIKFKVLKTFYSSYGVNASD